MLQDFLEFCCCTSRQSPAAAKFYAQQQLGAFRHAEPTSYANECAADPQALEAASADLGGNFLLDLGGPAVHAEGRAPPKHGSAGRGGRGGSVVSTAPTVASAGDSPQNRTATGSSSAFPVDVSAATASASHSREPVEPTAAASSSSAASPSVPAEHQDEALAAILAVVEEHERELGSPEDSDTSGTEDSGEEGGPADLEGAVSGEGSEPETTVLEEQQPESRAPAVPKLRFRQSVTFHEVPQRRSASLVDSPEAAGSGRRGTGSSSRHSKASLKSWASAEFMTAASQSPALSRIGSEGFMTPREMEEKQLEEQTEQGQSR